MTVTPGSSGRGLTPEGSSVSLEGWTLGAGPKGNHVLLHHVCRVQIDAPDTLPELWALLEQHACPVSAPASTLVTDRSRVTPHDHA